MDTFEVEAAVDRREAVLINARDGDLYRGISSATRFRMR
jgi:hypothetical protein